MLYSLVGILVIVLDQAVKFWVSNTLMGYDHVIFIPNVISLVSVYNDGCAFSFLDGGGARIYFIIACGVFTLLVILGLVTNFIEGPVARWSIVLVAAGGLGNCIDRVVFGYVHDMFMVELFDFAVFNVADIFITVFSIVFVFAMIFEKPPLDEDEDEDEDEQESLPEDDYDDYDDEPKKKGGLLARFKRNKDEEELAEPRSTKKMRSESYDVEKPVQSQSKRARVSEASEERYAEKPQPRQRPAQKSPAMDAPDPFADWEKANVSVNAKRAATVSAAMGEDVQIYKAPAPRQNVRSLMQEDAPRRSVQSEPPAAPRRAPAAAPEKASAELSFEEEFGIAPKPARKQSVSENYDLSRQSAAPSRAAAPSKAKGAEDDFDLDDILAEFK